jgi:hypothetical protein
MTVPQQDRPTPEMLSGVYVRIEAEEDISRRGRPRQGHFGDAYLYVEAAEDTTVKPWGRPLPPGPNAGESSALAGVADTLALIESEEDMTVRPLAPALLARLRRQGR